MYKKVYAFEWCHCIYESGFVVISLHHTMKGAVKARSTELKRREKEYSHQWRFHGGRKDRIEHYADGRTYLDKPFTNEKWRIRSIEIME